MTKRGSGGDAEPACKRAKPSEPDKPAYRQLIVHFNGREKNASIVNFQKGHFQATGLDYDNLQQELCRGRCVRMRAPSIYRLRGGLGLPVGCHVHLPHEIHRRRYS